MGTHHCTLIERATCRAAVRRESGLDLAKIICDLDGCADIGKGEVRIDLSQKYEFGTDREDPVFLAKHLQLGGPGTNCQLTLGN